MTESSGKPSDSDSGQNEKKFFVRVDETLNNSERLNEDEKNRAVEALFIIFGFVVVICLFVGFVRRGNDQIDTINNCKDQDARKGH